MDKVFVIGHKNPDSDSICAAIGYAAFKKKLGKENYVPCRIGEINDETKYILDYFKVDPPLFIENVKPQVSDMDYYTVDIIPQDMTIKGAWEIIRDKGHTLLPVRDQNNLFKGIVSVSDITQTYIALKDNDFLERYNVEISSIIEVLEAHVLWGEELIKKTAGRLFIYHNITWNDAIAIKNNDLILVAGNISNVIESMEYDSNYIFVVGNLKEKDEEVLAQYASIKNKAIIKVEHDLLSVIRLISQCISVKEIMKTEKIIYFYDNEYIDQIKDIMLESRHRYFPVIDYNRNVVGVISRKQLLTYRKKKVVLIDHNETSQTVKGIDQAEILEIIDHHRLGDIQTGNPIFVRNVPVGSSSTIVANMYFENNLKPDREIAGLLCAAIISDTLLFKSPTCTTVDIETANLLAEIADIDINTFGYEMLKAGASIVKKTPVEILMNDIKEYNLGKYRFSVSQINTMDLGELDDKREQLKELMKEKAENGKYDAVLLMVTDLLRQGSELIFEGPEVDRIRTAFGIEDEKKSVFLEGVVSRKKQIIPRLAMNI
ncbi:MAG: putative manganese-dependent inorganic diphosphatase [Clostridia bacterium]|jgi:manganese-dependent inorganic pyrophosphatase|uniref:putative manganese-dependent inorganic diphosphatase n=1 Tax=Petroclostridium xylanilyticum TaxID=1792311 RepID=UPI000B9871C8|nr:putative manganese-dependent inorganic diphosphatase [Petroclostridium xylanilyticum]MBZ4646295.1 putative manganese-dependent inorganic diphosphatase [Clostridia bacterium]